MPRPRGHLYQAHLRHLLTARLGVAFEPVVNGYAEVRGVAARRHRHVLQAPQRDRGGAQRVGRDLSSSRAGRDARRPARRRTTRSTPTRSSSVGDSEAAEAGFGAGRRRRCFGRRRLEPIAESDVDRVFHAMAGPEGLTRCTAIFTRADVIESLACAVGAACGAAQVEQLADRFLASPLVAPIQPTPRRDAAGGVIAMAPARRRLSVQQPYSTPALIELEATILDRAEQRLRHDAADRRAAHG